MTATVGGSDQPVPGRSSENRCLGAQCRPGGESPTRGPDSRPNRAGEWLGTVDGAGSPTCQIVPTSVAFG
jgi:hypothetical protein